MITIQPALRPFILIAGARRVTYPNYSGLTRVVRFGPKAGKQEARLRALKSFVYYKGFKFLNNSPPVGARMARKCYEANPAIAPRGPRELRLVASKNLQLSDNSVAALAEQGSFETELLSNFALARSAGQEGNNLRIWSEITRAGEMPQIGPAQGSRCSFPFLSLSAQMSSYANWELYSYFA